VPDLAINPGMTGLIRLGTVLGEGLGVGPAPGGRVAEIQALCDDLRKTHAGRAPSEIEGLGAARRLYRGFGIDPTSTRPSSEALLRRVLQGKPFPSVNAAVDLSNLCSVSFLLPIGLYDTAKLRGGVTLRRGLPEESYAGIRKDVVHLGGRPVLADDEGPFGNPTSDSRRTSIDSSTTSIWMVIFAPADYPAERLISHESFARDALDRHLRRLDSGPGLP